MRRMTLAVLGALISLPMIAPAGATPPVVTKPAVTHQPADLITVRNDRKKWRKHRGNIKRHGWRHGRAHHWRGHRGFRTYHRGYRRHTDGWWYPSAAFKLVIKPGRHKRSAHVRWCLNHYKSYRISDNTFQPYHGPRRKCVRH